MVTSFFGDVLLSMKDKARQGNVLLRESAHDSIMREGWEFVCLLLVLFYLEDFFAVLALVGVVFSTEMRLYLPLGE